jgi:serine/threonine protein kinase
VLKCDSLAVFSRFMFILSVVAFCHLQGVVHCDLKPEFCSLCADSKC